MLSMLILTSCSNSIVVIANRAELCNENAWTELKVSKADTKATQSDVIKLNERRKPWCTP